jgi:hypothetical protein
VIMTVRIDPPREIAGSTTEASGGP